MDCNEIRDLLEVYALGALDDSTTHASIEAHLLTCADCRQLLEGYQVVVQELPMALAAVSPYKAPPAMKQRLMRAIAETTPATVNPAISIKPSPKRVIPLHQRSSWQWVRRIGILVAIGWLIFSLIYIARLQVALAEERTLREQLEDQHIHQKELIFEVVDSPHSRKHFLYASANNVVEEGQPPPYGKIFIRDDMPYVVAMTGRLREAPVGQVYRLYLFRENGTYEIGGIVTVTEDGFSSLIYDSGQLNPQYVEVQVILQNESSTNPADGLPMLIWRPDLDEQAGNS